MTQISDEQWKALKQEGAKIAEDALKNIEYETARLTGETPKKFIFPDKSDEWFEDTNNIRKTLFEASSCGSIEIESAINNIASKKLFTKQGLRKTLKEITNSQVKVSIWVDVDMKGNPKQTSDNLKHLMDMYSIKLSLNDMSHELEQQGVSIYSDNIEDSVISSLEDLAIKHDMPYGRIKGLVKQIAYEVRYHPFDEYLKKLPEWDGVDRIKEILNTTVMIDTTDEYHKTSYMIFKKWLISIVAAVRRRKGSDPIRMVLVFAGAQHIGKTTFFKKLFPDDSLFKEGAHLDVKCKDSVLEATKYLCTELGEIDSTFSKSDISKLKAFLSKEMDEARLVYEKGTTKFPRKTVFCGTVNDPKFLVDQTGNSRFGVIHLIRIQWNQYNAVDRKQLWAQILSYFNAGEKWGLNEGELILLNERNMQHTEKTYIYQLIEEQLDWGSDESEWKWRTITEVAEILRFEDAAKKNTSAQRQLSSALMTLAERKEQYGARRTPAYKIPKLRSINMSYK